MMNANAPKTAASVNAPIRRKLARVSIRLTPHASRRVRRGRRRAPGPGPHHAPFAVEVGFDPWVVGLQEFFDFPDCGDLAMPENRHAIADREQTVEVVG